MRQYHDRATVAARKGPLYPVPTAPLHPLLRLQHNAGNRAVAALLVQRDGPSAQQGGVGQQAVTAARAGQWTQAEQLLNGQEMSVLLDALEEVRAAGLLDDISAHIDGTPGISPNRMWAAVLAVQLHLGSRFRQYGVTLPGDQRDAITHHCFMRILAGGSPDVLRRTRDGARFTAPGPVENAAWTRQFLEFFGFGAPPIRDPASVVFNGASTTMTDVVDTVTEQAALAGYLLTDTEVRTVATRAYDDSRGAAHSVHFSLTFSFIPWTGHVNVTRPTSGEKTGHDLPGAQVGGTLTFQLHRDDEPGWEVSAVANVTFFADEGGSFRPQNVQAGGQAAWVVPFARGWLQAGGFIQAIGGAALRQHQLDGVNRVTADPSAQVAAGAQLLLVVPGTDRHVMLGVQMGGSATGSLPPGSRTGPVNDQPTVTGDLSGNVFLQVQF